jgi:hypothetical protein
MSCGSGFSFFTLRLRLALGVASKSSSSSSLLLLEEVLKDLVFLRFEAGVDLAEAVALVGVLTLAEPLLVTLLRDSFLIFW